MVFRLSHRPLPADFSVGTREISRLSGRKPQISNCLDVGGAAQSLPPASSGSTKCSDHQCPLLGARWSCSFNRRVTTAWKYILSWSRSQGLFAGVALEVATLREDLNDNATLYGKKLENREIVTKGVRPPKAAAKLLELLNRYSAKERKN